MKELSILIPSRNERWLRHTVEDILRNREAQTEVIVVLDGALPTEPIPTYPDVTIVSLPKSVGQRAACNVACKLSQAKYVMKVDAHCSFDKGFDRKLIEVMQDNWTLVPAMRNLHAFDWVCECGFRKYQGPTIPCPECGKEMHREVVWVGKKSPLSTSYRFTSQLEFKYWKEYKQHQHGDIVDTLSLQGSCFMITRERYLGLDICDESLGSWGGQGSEVALKTWLSGGEVKVNKNTWYAHLFRTQGGDFSFPYPNPGKEQKNAKDSLRRMFLNDLWPLAVHNIQWLIDRFAPVPDWGDKGVVYYTDHQLPLRISRMVQKRLEKMGLPISSASLKPMSHFGTNIVVEGKRGRATYLKQILTALENCPHEIVYFCEHDVLYHPSHFAFTPPEKDKFYFNTNVWKWNMDKGYGLKVDDCKQVSGMCCYRELALDFYKNKASDRHYEPQHDRVAFHSDVPIIDIRHSNNFTKNRWTKEEFRNKKYTEGWTESESIPGWDCNQLRGALPTKR